LGVSMSRLGLDSDDLVTLADQAVSEIRGFAWGMEEDYVGIFGVSLGSIYSSIAFGLDSRIESAFLVHGVGGLTQLMKNSDDRLAKSLWDDIDLSLVDPLNYIDNTKGNIFMVNGSKDKETNIENALKLRDAWKAGYKEYPCGHGGLALF